MKLVFRTYATCFPNRIILSEETIPEYKQYRYVVDVQHDEYKPIPFQKHTYADAQRSFAAMFRRWSDFPWVSKQLNFGLLAVHDDTFVNPLALACFLKSIQHFSSPLCSAFCSDYAIAADARGEQCNLFFGGIFITNKQMLEKIGSKDGGTCMKHTEDFQPYLGIVDGAAANDDHYFSNCCQYHNAWRLPASKSIRFNEERRYKELSFSSIAEHHVKPLHMMKHVLHSIRMADIAYKRDFNNPCSSFSLPL